MMHNKKWLVIGGLIVILIVAPALFMNGTDKLSDEFAGTYVTGNGPNMIYFSVDPVKDYEFFYTDQNNEIYIKGKATPTGGNAYEIICDSLDAQKLIETQVIQYEDKSFLLTVGQQGNEFTAYTFEKVDDIPTVFGSLENYK